MKALSTPYLGIFPFGVVSCSTLPDLNAKQEPKAVHIFFTVDEGMIILIHGFRKKSQKTPKEELDTARKRLRLLK